MKPLRGSYCCRWQQCKMENEILKQLLNNVHIQDAIKSAKLFCDLIESVMTTKYEQDEFIDRLHERLGELYANSIDLPKIELLVEENNQEDEARKTFPELYSKLAEILGEYADYSTSFDPTILGEKDNYLQGWLTDDLADIHMDLKDILSNLEKDTDQTIQDALWDLKFGFGNHWGNHLIDALRFLHYVRYGHLGRHMI